MFILSHPGHMQGGQQDTNVRLTKNMPGSTSEGNNKMSRNNDGQSSSCTSKNNDFDDIDVLQKVYASNHPRGNSMLAHAEEERTIGNHLGVKRPHMDTRSPRNECIRSPLNNKDTNREVSGNAFVTAKTKLVSSK